MQMDVTNIPLDVDKTDAGTRYEVRTLHFLHLVRVVRIGRQHQKTHNEKVTFLRADEINK